MLLSELILAIQGTVIVSGDHLHDPVRHLVATDLMSEVLLAEDEDLLMFTSLTTEHAVRTAHVLGALGVVVLDNHDPKPAMLRAAADLGVTLARTPWTRAAVLTWAKDAL